ncbi:hypothetical protein ABIE51_002732 [Lysobacter sp. OAE881]
MSVVITGSPPPSILYSGDAVQLAEQVVHRDLHRRLRAGVLLQRGLDQLRDAVEVRDFLADQARRDELVDGLDDGAVRVAGDDRRRRRFAIADVTGVGMHADDDVLDRLDRAQRGLERRFQRDAQHAEPDLRDLHSCRSGMWGRVCGGSRLTAGCAGCW